MKPDPVTTGPSRERSIERGVALAFLLAAAAGVALIVTFWRGGQPQLEGLFLGIAFAGIGAGLVVWANGLLGGGPYEEERERLRATRAERTALAVDLGRGEELERRTLLQRTLVLALAAVAGALVLPLRSLGPKPGRKLLQTKWAAGVRVVTEDGAPLRVDDVPEDGLLTVFPDGDLGSADGQTVLVRVDPALLRLPAGREDWAPSGIVAYSKVCSHAGCPVGLYEARRHELLCPCHQSAFDVLSGAHPTSGPAAWPLPQLPLSVDAEGVLRATGDFDAPVGPGWWKT